MIRGMRIPDILELALVLSESVSIDREVRGRLASRSGSSSREVCFTEHCGDVSDLETSF